MKGRIIPYSAAELAWVEAHATLSTTELHREFCAAFGRDDVSSVNLKAMRQRKGWRTGRTGHFARGLSTWNKGLKEFCPPGSEKGQFKKGERRGVAVQLYKPIGTERLSKNGYLERKIHDDLPLQSRWRAVHLVEWQGANGPLPKGMALKCLDGNKTNTQPGNWEMIPRALLPRMAGCNGKGPLKLSYDDAPAELKPSIFALAKLEHAMRKRRGTGKKSKAAQDRGASP